MAKLGVGVSRPPLDSERVTIVRFHAQPSEDGESAGEFLRRLLTNPGIDAIALVVAWVRYRGLARLRAELDAFRERGHSRIIVGIDEEGATRPGLIGAVRSFSEAYVFHVREAGTFHPKLYFGEGPGKAYLFVGSSNFTPGGLFFNDEVALEAEFDLPVDAGEPALLEVRAYIERLLADAEVCLRLTEELVDRLLADPRYRVSGTERRARRTDVPLPPGADEEDAEQGGETPSEADTPEPIFGSSQRARPVVPGLSEDARNELAELEVDLGEPVLPEPPGPPPGPSQPPAVAPAAGPPSPTVVASWSKILPSGDAQQPEAAATNPTGVLRLSQAGHDINWRTWFRQVLFGAAPWATTADSRGNPTETATIPMDVTIAGVPRGVVNLRVDHAPHREAGQANVPTILHWGPTLSAILHATDYHGHTVMISQISDGTYRLEIA